MKKIAFRLFWTFMCLHTSISFSTAATGTTVDTAIAEIDAIISESDTHTRKVSTFDSDTNLELNSAPSPNTQLIYTPWELMHRTAMLQGFTWSGTTANFVTPAMYIGTPLQTNMSTAGYNTSLGATNYAECVRMESDVSFGVDGELIEKTTEAELRNIAKYCATEYLGSYFNGKDYTTREEMLMMLFVMFDESVSLPGYFNEKQFIFDGEETETNYSNVGTRAWFAPYISLASDLGMVEDIGNWGTAKMATDSDIQLMLNMYLMDEDGEMIDGIETEYGTYYITYDEDRLTIKKVHKTATSTSNNTATGSQNITQPSRYPGCDTDDIVLPNGQIWAACNVGASKAGTGEESYGSLFQWGRNVPFASTGSVKTVQGPLSYEDAMKTTNAIESNSEPYDWINIQNNNLWGGGVSSTYKIAGKKDQSLMQGACENGYHVPTKEEWCDAIDNIRSQTGCKHEYSLEGKQKVINTLHISLPGGRSAVSPTNYNRTEKLPNIPSSGDATYWTSTPTGNYSESVGFSPTGWAIQVSIEPGWGIFRGSQGSIRCLKN